MFFCGLHRFRSLIYTPCGLLLSTTVPSILLSLGVFVSLMFIFYPSLYVRFVFPARLCFAIVTLVQASHCFPPLFQAGVEGHTGGCRFPRSAERRDERVNGSEWPVNRRRETATTIFPLLFIYSPLDCLPLI